MNVAIVVILIVVVGGAIVAIGWWQLADKLFPGTARKTGQGLPRPRPDRKAGAVVISGFDASKPEQGDGPAA